MAAHVFILINYLSISWKYRGDALASPKNEWWKTEIFLLVELENSVHKVIVDVFQMVVTYAFLKCSLD